MKKKCEICGTTENLQEHHIVPLSEGGEDSFLNRMTVCTECHGKLHGKKRIANPKKNTKSQEFIHGIGRSVWLEDKHIEWIEENSINFSKWVRKKLDDEMSKEIEI